MINVLWLASWYPNQLSKFDGDFLQRHAKAVGLYCRVHVIYIVKDEKKLVTKDAKTELRSNGNLTEQIIYYAAPKTGFRILDKYLSQRKYTRLYQNAVNSYIADNGKPRLVHVQIAMKAGLAALWIKRKWGIPYIVSEQWTAYLSNADLKITDYPFIFQKLLKKILNEAAAVTVVSDHLGKAVQKHFPTVQYQVIPNVVDTDIFYPAQNQKTVITRFIHISNMNFQKNSEAILKALSILKYTVAFEMYMYGTANPVLLELISSLGLQKHVFTKGEVPQPQLAGAIRESDALILYSRYETFGCVLIEANACGVPVIVSDIEVFHEIIKQGVNGIFAKSENPEALAEKLKDFTSQKNNFDKISIAEATAGKYRFSKVGQSFFDLYNRLLIK